MKQRRVFFTAFIFSLACAGIFSFASRVHAAALSDGMLVRGSGPEVYVMENGMRRWIVSEGIFSDLELEWEKIRSVSDGDIAAYPRGKDIVSGARYPDGMLVRGGADLGGDGKKVYLIEKGTKRWVETERDFNNLRLDWGFVMDISPEKLKRVSQGKMIQGSSDLIPPATVLIDTPKKTLEDVYATFRFNGITPRQDNKTLKFETFLEGVDAGWVAASGGERKVKLPEKSGSYRFFVRAKDMDGMVDRTPEQYAFEVILSPLYGAVTLSGNPRSDNPATEQLTVQGKTSELINITGWTLTSEKYRTSYTIPDAYEIPNHPFLEKKADISVYSKSKAVIITGQSASGMNFRLNKCIGYLNQYYMFVPPLQNTCPAPSKTDAEQFDAYCKKIILQAANCREPNPNDMLINNECRAYINEHLNYSKCVEANYAYFDFYSDEWRVYLGHVKDIWENDKDTIMVRDKSGLVVARYAY